MKTPALIAIKRRILTNYQKEWWTLHENRFLKPEEYKEATERIGELEKELYWLEFKK